MTSGWIITREERSDAAIHNAAHDAADSLDCRASLVGDNHGSIEGQDLFKTL